MKNILVFIFILLAGSVNSLKAFTVNISGKAPADYHLKLRCGSLIEDKLLDQNQNGDFKFTIDLKYPAQFQLEYGNKRGAAFDFFVFSESKITIDIKDESKTGLKVTGLSQRSEAFASIEPLMFDKYSPKLKKTVSYDSLLNALVVDIKNIPNIGNDEYTNVIAKCGRLVLMTTLLSSNLTPIFNVYDSPDFNEIPKQEEKFAGFVLYNNLMWPGWVEKVRKRIIYAKGDNKYKPSLKEMLEQFDLQKGNVLPKSYVNARYTALVSADKGKMTEEEKANWEKEVSLFCKTYPDYQFTIYLRQTYEEYTNSMINKPAPDFSLKDINGKTVSLSTFKGKYILVDFWGSWCAPCRVYNKELIKLNETLKSKDIEIVSIAFDKTEEEWKKAIEEDHLNWTQLFYNEELLKDYKVIAYPTVFLISPDQLILKRSNHLTAEDLEEYIK